jgi:acetyltransferase
VAVVAQSGGVNLTVGFLLQKLGTGVSLAVGLGNAVDVGTSDVLDFLADDDNTAAIALHLEGVPDGRRLFESIKRVSVKKPVVVLAAGRSDVGEFAVSHTGNLMGSHLRTVSALSQAGAIVVDTTDDLAQAAVVMAGRRLKPARSNAFGVVTGQAGPGLLIVDGLKSAGLEVPELAAGTIHSISRLLPPLTFMKNPVDTGRPGPSFGEIVNLVAVDEKVDATLVFGLSEPSVLNPAVALRSALESSSKPLLFGTLGTPTDVQDAADALAQLGVPTLQSPERMVLAAKALDADSRAQWRLSQSVDPTGERAAEVLSGAFDEARAKSLLDLYGIRRPASCVCPDRDAALRAFKVIGKPVVVKVVSAEIAHKTEAGGVFLNVRHEGELEHALAAIDNIPTSGPKSVLVEEMADPGVELIVGGVHDASWGPCIMIGIGGVAAEAMADTSVRLAPLTPLDVEGMLNGLRGRRLLDGFRNLPVCDRNAIADVVIAISRLMIVHPEIAEIEINPLRVTAKSALALDALVQIARPQEGNP